MFWMSPIRGDSVCIPGPMVVQLLRAEVAWVTRPSSAGGGCSLAPPLVAGFGAD